MGTETRSLLSADRLAFGVGVLAYFGQFFYPPLLLVVVLAVFLPSVLREFGWLRDGDEWTHQVMYRAGFHSLLATVGVIFLGWVAPLLEGSSEISGITTLKDVLHGEFLRKIAIDVFLVSYLLQYWGGRRGVQRILLGVAILSLAPAITAARFTPDMRTTALAIGLAMFAAFLALSFASARFPRVSGRALLVLCTLALVVCIRDTVQSQTGLVLLAPTIQAFLVFGVTGIALLRDPVETD